MNNNMFELITYLKAKTDFNYNICYSPKKKEMKALFRIKDHFVRYCAVQIFSENFYFVL